jgi:hypothetical protein
MNTAQWTDDQIVALHWTRREMYRPEKSLPKIGKQNVSYQLQTNHEAGECSSA